MQEIVVDQCENRRIPFHNLTKNLIASSLSRNPDNNAQYRGINEIKEANNYRGVIETKQPIPVITTTTNSRKDARKG